MRKISEIQGEYSKSFLSIVGFENELKLAKENLQLAKEFLTIVEFWNNRSEFTFTTLSGHTLCLFDEKTFFDNWGDFRKDFVDSVKHFLEMYKICYTSNHPQVKELKKLLEYIRNFSKLFEKERDRYDTIVSSFVQEKVIQ